jgi:hypothetical protein
LPARPARAAQRRGQRRARGDRHARADNPVGAENAEVGVGDVHRAAQALVGSRDPGEQLGQHGLGGEPLGQAVAVAAVI